MKKILVATKSRGFLKELFDSDFKNIEFLYRKEKIYETNSKIKKIVSNILRSRIGNLFRIIQVIDMREKGQQMDIIFSYNRFLKTNKPYVIYLENPLALVHYSTSRPNSIFCKSKLNKLFTDKNLKSIVCMSEACYETLPIIYSIPKTVDIKRIYPLVPNEPPIEKNFTDNLECTYISSAFYLKGGREILESHRLLNKGEHKIKLTIIARIDEIKHQDLDYIKNNSETIELLEFNLGKKELSDIYNRSHVILNVSRQDSFPMVVFEGIKHGNIILSSNLYAQTEMVDEGENGYQTDVKYRFFNKDNLPNPKVWNHRSKTIHSEFLDEEVVSFLIEKLKYLDLNRKEVEIMCNKSKMKSESLDFNSDKIHQEWSDLFEEIGRGGDY